MVDQVNPLVDFALSDRGELTLANAAEQGGIASAASSYRLQWARFDNATGLPANVDYEVTISELRAQAPAALTSDHAQQFVEVQVAAINPQFPSWTKPVTMQFRRVGQGWRMVGLVKLPDEGSTPGAHVKVRHCARRAGADNQTLFGPPSGLHKGADCGRPDGRRRSGSSEFKLPWKVLDLEGRQLLVQEAVYEGAFGTPNMRQLLIERLPAKARNFIWTSCRSRAGVGVHFAIGAPTRPVRRRILTAHRRPLAQVLADCRIFT